uniref:Uncharacterized protein n=1 Tax=Sphaerodactylus townsendi TaxID=933632 RepID=A0ACB8FAN7_9SAUR
MSHTERSLLDCDNEELERTLRSTAAGADSVVPLLSETAAQHILAGTRAACMLQFGPSDQTAAQSPIHDSFGCYLLTWSEPGQDIPSDWDYSQGTLPTCPPPRLGKAARVGRDLSGGCGGSAGGRKGEAGKTRQGGSEGGEPPLMEVEPGAAATGGAQRVCCRPTGCYRPPAQPP